MQIEKNCAETSARLTYIARTWYRRWLSLKGIVEVVNVFIASVITCCLSVVVEEVGEGALSFYVGREYSTYEPLYLLPTIIKE